MICSYIFLLCVFLLTQSYADIEPVSTDAIPENFGIYDPHPRPILEFKPPSRIIVQEGDELTIECDGRDQADHSMDEEVHELRVSITADNHPDASLTRGDIGFYGFQVKTLKFVPNDEGRVDVLETFKLQITKNKISKDDQGWYMCKACVDGEDMWGDHVEICDDTDAKFFLDVQSPTTGDDVLGQSNKMAPRSTCQIFGDPNVITYDGRFYHAHTSPCTYVLSMDSVNFSWFVYGTLGECGVTVTGSCLKSVTIHYGRESLALERGWLINYQGDKHEVIEKGGLTKGPFKIAFNGANVAVTVTLNKDGETEDQLVVLWDGYVSAVVQSPMGVPTMGLCGNNDGDESNDFDLWGVAHENSQFLCDSMQVDRYGQCSVGARPATLRQACNSPEARQKSRSVCLDILYGGDFAPCFATHSVNNFLDACIYDQCKGLNITNNLYPELYIPDIDSKVQPACVVASAYATRCSGDFWISSTEMAEKQSKLVLWNDSKGFCPDWEKKQKIYPKLGCPQSVSQYSEQI